MKGRKVLHSAFVVATGGSPQTKPSSASGEWKKESVPKLLDVKYLHTSFVPATGSAGLAVVAQTLATLIQIVDW
jgi:hypothetical protein